MRKGGYAVPSHSSFRPRPIPDQRPVGSKLFSLYAPAATRHRAAGTEDATHADHPVGRPIALERDGGCTPADRHADGLSERRAQPCEAQDTAAWDLRATGPDALFDTADDLVYGLAVASDSPADPWGQWQVRLFVQSGPLLAGGQFRLTARDSITNVLGDELDGDDDGVPGGDCSKEFTLDLSAPATLEGTANDTLETATPLTLIEDPAASGYFLARSGRHRSRRAGRFLQRVGLVEFSGFGRRPGLGCR